MLNQVKENQRIADAEKARRRDFVAGHSGLA